MYSKRYKCKYLQFNSEMTHTHTQLLTTKTQRWYTQFSIFSNIVQISMEQSSPLLMLTKFSPGQTTAAFGRTTAGAELRSCEVCLVFCLYWFFSYADWYIFSWWIDIDIERKHIYIPIHMYVIMCKNIYIHVYVRIYSDSFHFDFAILCALLVLLQVGLLS